MQRTTAKRQRTRWRNQIRQLSMVNHKGPRKGSFLKHQISYMNGINRLSNPDDSGTGPIRITLISMLVPLKIYRLEGNGPYIYKGIHDGEYVFAHRETNQLRHVSRSEMNKMISSNGVIELRDMAFSDVTVPEYAHLDRLTNNLFSTPTVDLWDRTGVLDTFSRTELLQLNDLCKERDMYDLPTPGDNEYMELIRDPRWQLLKRYIQFFSPDTELPEQFA